MGNSSPSTLSPDLAENAGSAAQTHGATPTQLHPTPADDVHLLTLLVVGFVLLGGDELMRRVREFQEELQAQAELYQAESREDESVATLARYLTLGLLFASQRWAIQGMRSWLLFVLAATNATLDTGEALSSTTVVRPLHRPIQTAMRSLRVRARNLIREGRMEDRSGRWLAEHLTPQIIDDLIAYISQNPALAELVRNQLGQQSIGLAGVAVEGARDVSLTADNVVENVVRRLFRRPPREDLPESPFAGNPDLGAAYEEITPKLAR